jgi:hypothetical protein
MFSVSVATLAFFVPGKAPQVVSAQVLAPNIFGSLLEAVVEHTVVEVAEALKAGANSSESASLPT